MSTNNGSNRHRSRSQPSGRRTERDDLWREPAALGDIEPISMPVEVGALLRSLGDPPLRKGSVAVGYFNAVAERAAAVALALAISVDLLAHSDD